jgi:hypothetical protein
MLIYPYAARCAVESKFAQRIAPEVARRMVACVLFLWWADFSSGGAAPDCNPLRSA